jgi:L-rhamnose mutarotase
MTAGGRGERVCFVMRARVDTLDEYKARHRKVWPEMLEALRRTGWTNYSLFALDEGTIVGYLETDDFDRAVAAMQNESVNARWQAEMAPLFEVQAAPDQALARLEEIFHLD